MTTRDDIHRPSQIRPEDYDFVALDYIGPGLDAIGAEAALAGERALLDAHRKATGATGSTHDHGGTCACCGATAMHLVVWHHRPTNQYIKTGPECAAYIAEGTAPRMHALRARVDRARKGTTARERYKAGKAKAREILADLDLAIDIDNMDQEHHIVQDIVDRLIRHGSISDAQVDLVRRLQAQQAQRAQDEARWAQEKEAASDIPVFPARATIEGVVVKVREPDPDAQFPTWKILVKHQDGWMVWGSRPRALEDVERGDRVRFDARIQTSSDDPKFGFFSRPTKPEILEVAGQ